MITSLRAALRSPFKTLTFSRGRRPHGWILVAFALSGCATGYHSHSWVGGYYEYPAGAPNRFVVGFSGNGYTHAALAAQYAHRRAGELCQEKGFKGYRVLDRHDQSVAYRTPGSSSCSGSRLGNHVSATCTENGSDVITKPGQELTVECENQ